MSSIDKSLRLLNAVIEAQDRGIPLGEAATKISGSAELWLASIDEVIEFIGSGEPLEIVD
jgi:hypothetical protein